MNPPSCYGKQCETCKWRHPNRPNHCEAMSIYSGRSDKLTYYDVEGEALK